MMNLQYVAVIKDSQIVGNTPLEIFSSHGIILHKGLFCLLSGICHIAGRRRKGKGLEVPCKYTYYCGPTEDPVFIQDPAFIFVTIVIFPSH